MKATVTGILIVLPVSSASSETDSRLFQVVLDLEDTLGIIAIKRLQVRLQVRQLSSLKPMKTIALSYLRKNLLTMHDRDRNIRMYLS